MERLVAVFCLVMSLYWAYTGWNEYGFWENRGPGAGFIPVLAGIFTSALSAYIIYRSEKLDWNTFKLPAFYPALAVFAGLLSMNIIGMVAFTFILTTAWLKFMARYTLRRSCLIGLGMTCFVFLVFKLWLDVPLPVGILGV